MLCVCVLPFELKDSFVLFSPIFAHIPPPQNVLSMLLLLVISVYNCTLLWEDAAHSWCYKPLMTFWSLACFCPAVLLYKVSSPVVVLGHAAVKSTLAPIHYKMIHMGNSLKERWKWSVQDDWAEGTDCIDEYDMYVKDMLQRVLYDFLTSWRLMGKFVTDCN